MAVDADLATPQAVFLHDSKLYIADSLHNKVRVVDEAGVISMIAGSGPNRGASPNGLAARAAPITRPQLVTVGPGGLLYVSMSRGSADDLADHIDTFTDDYNRMRPREAIDWQRPLDRYLTHRTPNRPTPRPEQERNTSMLEVLTVRPSFVPWV